MNEHLDSSATPHRAANIVRWVALALVVVGVVTWLSFALFHGTTTEPMATGPSVNATPVPQPGHYQGPRVAFDYPGGWSELLPTRVNPWYAAYKPPTSDGRDALVAVGPGLFLNDQDPERGLLGYFSNEVAGPSSITRTNGLLTYSVPLAWVGRHGQSLEGTGMLIVGQRGTTHIARCQYDSDPYLADRKAQVLAACDMLKKTLAEVPPPKIVEPSGCTKTELSLLQSISMPPGIEAGIPHMRQRACEMAVEVPYEDKSRVFDNLESRLAAAGWDRNPWSTHEVLVANRDFDHYVVVVRPEGKLTSRFTIHAGDG
jgi:hypothetical protein